MTNIESFGSAAATLGGGFFVGILIGYALKKVIKIAAVIVGLFLAGLVYLQSQEIANIYWNKLQQVPEGTITTLSNAITQIQDIDFFSFIHRTWMHYSCIVKECGCHVKHMDSNCPRVNSI
jgi:uncharacterized membrane protein (Fun14 family)